MNKVVAIIFRVVGILLVVTCLACAAVWGYILRPSSTPCSSINYIIEDSHVRKYVFTNELDLLLQNEHISPIGQPINRLSLQRIENAVKRHPMVRTAECYATPWGTVWVTITQRVPLLRVQTATETFLVDTDHRIMQSRPVIKEPLLLVTGNVGPQMATMQLADFAQWLQNDSYWNGRIHHLQVRSPRMVVVYLNQQGMPRVVLGEMNGYKTKLSKLKTLLEQGNNILEEKHYTELDIRFRGQVIGRGQQE